MWILELIISARYGGIRFFKRSFMKNFVVSFNWQSSFRIWRGNFVLTFCRCCVTFFVHIYVLLRFLNLFFLDNTLEKITTIFSLKKNLILFSEDSLLLTSNSNNQGDNSNDNGSNTNNVGSDSNEESDSDISEPLSDTDSVRGTSRVMDALDLLDKARKGDPQAKKEIEQKHLEGKAATEENLNGLEKFLEESYYIQDDKEQSLLKKINSNGKGSSGSQGPGNSEGSGNSEGPGNSDGPGNSEGPGNSDGPGPSDGPSSANTGTSNRAIGGLGIFLGWSGGILENLPDILPDILNSLFFCSIINNIGILGDEKAKYGLTFGLIFKITKLINELGSKIELKLLKLRALTCIMIIYILTRINLFMYIFFILLSYSELLSSFFYCADGSKKDSKEDSKEDSLEDWEKYLEEDSEESSKEDSEKDSKEDSEKDSKEDSEEDSEKDSKEDSEKDSEVDELANYVKKHLQISKEIKDIKNELSRVDREIEERAKNLSEGANKDNSDEEPSPEDSKIMSPNEYREYLKDEIERLQDGKKLYVSDIAEAKESKGENMEVDSLTGNKRKESSTEDTKSSTEDTKSSTEDTKSSKRQKSSNNDDSSGPSAPSGSSGPSAPSGPSASTGSSVGGDGGIPSGSNYTEDSSYDSENDSSNHNNNGGSKFFKIDVLILVLIFMLKGLSEVLDILFNNFL
uniref:Uncharacterized protein n=1 Tax=Annulohypoxylon stygium TaxID=326628 RepID=A0A386RWU6_9PEZI|nr:hypothetical protein [Annulohypoxylon stygium]